MLYSHLELNINPNNKHLEIVKNWLIEEWKKENRGFYCNWNIIEKSFYCSPKESEFFWKKMGFIKFPDIEYSIHELTYFKPLIKIQSVIENDNNNNSKNRIDLWNVEPHLKDKYKPKWSWDIDFENGKLKLPIIQPCNFNWNLRWSINGNTIIEDKVKYFNKRLINNEYTPFLYIHRLIEK